MELYYILTTQIPRCLNDLIGQGRFDHIYQSQPESGEFLEKVAKAPRDRRPFVHFAFFDRVPNSDGSWGITGTYKLKDFQVDSAAGLYKEREHKYSLFLQPEEKFERPIPFRQGTDLWEALAKTKGKKTTSFYSGGRMLLPISVEDFEKIIRFSRRTEEAPEAELTPERNFPTGVPLSVEADLRNYLSEHLEDIEKGLQPYDPDNYVEFDTGAVGRIDLLAKDSSGNIVVIELKKGRADDQAVGQLCRYLGWVKEHLAKGQHRVRGRLIANVISDKLLYAVLPIPDVDLASYEVSFSIRSVSVRK